MATLVNKEAIAGVKPSSLPADRLLKRAQRGDLEAFAELFEALRPAVYRTVCRLAGPDEADDIVMEVFLKAWQALPRFRGGSSLSTWLYRIAHNGCMDARRRQQRRRETSLSADAQEGESPLPDVPDERQTAPDRQLAERERAQRVREALRTLSAEAQTALTLRYADGLSYAEIAAATGVSLGTVMSRLFYAKRRLKRALLAAGIEDWR